MFRNPRENVALRPSETILPSTGRPPTPPSNGSTAPYLPFTKRTASSDKNRMSGLVSPTPVLGRQPSKPASGKKHALKPNQSILSFFGKAEKKEESEELVDSGLFFNSGGDAVQPSPEKVDTRDEFIASQASDDLFRFNEDVTPVKRRKIAPFDNEDFPRTPSPERDLVTPAKMSEPQAGPQKLKVRKSRGGFVADSSDEEDDIPSASTPVKSTDGPDHINHEDDEATLLNTEQFEPTTTKVPQNPADNENDIAQDRRVLKSETGIPTLSRENTSMMPPDDFGDEDFEDEEFYEEGEEYLERRWMQEQREMEIGLEDDSKSESGTDSIRTPNAMDEDIEKQCTPNENITACPMCNGNMQGLSESEASAHVNACLDGTAAPLPKEGISERGEPNVKEIKQEVNASPQYSMSVKRFQRSAIARPAQANPFSMAAGGKTGGSAFSKLMSGHAEDAAWAEAAANEAQSRGKPAYQRTCPFYKIMPGLKICVDAFRYGKVEGQQAYFLSHFHSDHYIGLTSQWCHGPIYASKISCNLMRQQLKVDAKWLCPLEFEKKVEVPGTDGVYVTMIPANHCPGSSLFLFEKIVGKNKDGASKLNRILHCGDFRACPAHISHPLLMPDVLDTVTGLNKQQIIDTCYLDTTYLTPKFSFPSQSDVIDACAQMCVSLAKGIKDSSDSWEKVKLAKAGSAMKKFLEDGKQEIIKPDDDADAEDQKPKVRGRLLVVIGTYSIGKERICLGIARALKSKIYAPPSKMRICKALEDEDLNSFLTSNPLEAQVHMQMLMEIRAETLHDYLITFKGHFHRVVGFRPTGWTYRPPTSRFTDNPAISTVLHSEGWKSRFTMHDLAPQRGSTKESNCFGVPYSEHSSFRELTMFCCALRINRIVPTVNVGSARSRERMKGWIEKWDAEKRKNGLFKVEVGAEGWGSGDGKLRYGV